MYTVRIRSIRRNLSVPIAYSSPHLGIHVGRTTYLRGGGSWAITKNKITCTANATENKITREKIEQVLSTDHLVRCT